MNFGERLKLFRKEAGMTQGELAKKAGIGTASISDYELNKYKPATEALYGLADALQCTVDYLIGREEEDGTVDIKYNGYIPNDEELEILAAYKKLNAKQKATIRTILATYIEEN